MKHDIYKVQTHSDLKLCLKYEPKYIKSSKGHVTQWYMGYVITLPVCCIWYSTSTL